MAKEKVVWRGPGSPSYEARNGSAGVGLTDGGQPSSRRKIVPRQRAIANVGEDTQVAKAASRTWQIGRYISAGIAAPIVIGAERLVKKHIPTETDLLSHDSRKLIDEGINLNRVVEAGGQDEVKTRIRSRLRHPVGQALLIKDSLPAPDPQPTEAETDLVFEAVRALDEGDGLNVSSVRDMIEQRVMEQTLQEASKIYGLELTRLQAGQIVREIKRWLQGPTLTGGKAGTRVIMNISPKQLALGAIFGGLRHLPKVVGATISPTELGVRGIQIVVTDRPKAQGGPILTILKGGITGNSEVLPADAYPEWEQPLAQQLAGDTKLGRKIASRIGLPRVEAGTMTLKNPKNDNDQAEIPIIVQQKEKDSLGGAQVFLTALGIINDALAHLETYSPVEPMGQAEMETQAYQRTLSWVQNNGPRPSVIMNIASETAQKVIASRKSAEEKARRQQVEEEKQKRVRRTSIQLLRKYAEMKRTLKDNPRALEKLEKAKRLAFKRLGRDAATMALAGYDPDETQQSRPYHSNTRAIVVSQAAMPIRSGWRGALAGLREGFKTGRQKRKAR